MKIEFIVQEVKVQILLNEFKVHFFIMQNAGYKHFGFLSTVLHSLKDLCKNKKIYRLLCVHEKPLNFTYRTMHTELPIVPSAHFVVWFLGHHKSMH